MDALKFSFVGDVAVSREDATSVFRHVRHFVQDVDFGVFNLEGQICDGTTKNPAKIGQGMPERSSLNAAAALHDFKLNVASMANNHTMDFGVHGLRQSMEILDAENIQHCGAGENRKEAEKAIFAERNGVRIAFLSLTSVFPPSYAAGDEAPGAAVCRIQTNYVPNPRTFTNPGVPMYVRTSGDPADTARVMTNIREAKSQADVVIVLWHWGVSERLGIVTEYQRTLGKAAIDAGADAVVGNHAHMMLGVEFHQGRPIFHSLGNFGFDRKHPYFCDDSSLILADVGKNGLSNIRLVPALINTENEPVAVRTDSLDGMKYQWMMEKLSEGMNTTFIPEGSHFRLQPTSSLGAATFDAKDAKSLEKLGYTREQIEELKVAGALV